MKTARPPAQPPYRALVAPPRLVTRSVGRPDDVRAFFDEAAAGYRDAHGGPEHLLRYRLGVLRDLLPEPRCGLIVEIGCGTAMHLLGLADSYDQAVGLDLSPAMIARCERERQHHPLRERLRFSVDRAEELLTLGDGTADVLICVGAFEHILDQPRAAAQIRRVLKPGGAFVCLTPNGGYLWYSLLAPCLRLDTKHLSTDRFLTTREWVRLLRNAGFAEPLIRPWTFIPRGDIPASAARLLEVLDRWGRRFRVSRLRGGLAVRSVTLSS